MGETTSSAAAEAMRRILVERARRKKSSKQGRICGVDLVVPSTAVENPVEDLLALDEALTQFQQHGR